SILRALGRHTEALELAENALAIWELTLGGEHPRCAWALLNLAELYARAGDRDAARKAILRALRVLDAFANSMLPALSLAEQRAFIEQNLSLASVHAMALLHSPEAVEEGYAAFAGWKGLLLRGLRQQAILEQEGAAPSPMRPEDRALVGALLEARTDVAAAFREGLGGPVLNEREAVRERLEREAARIVSAVGLSDPWAEGGLDTLRSVLPAGAAFIDVHRAVFGEGDTRYGAVVTTRERVLPWVEIGRAEAIEEAVTTFRKRRSSKQLEALQACVWAPLANALPGGVERIWVAPDGVLERVPWSVVTAAHEGGPLVAQVASARDLLRLLVTPPPEDAGTVLLVGDLSYGAPRGKGAVMPLPRTAQEIAAIARLARGNGLDVLPILNARRATPAAVGEAAEGAAYLHVATHGYFGRTGRWNEVASVEVGPWGETKETVAPVGVGVRSPLAGCGLALSDANEGPAGELTAEAVLRLRLDRTRLAVLSACETGRGAEVGGQGVMGLPMAFQAAGVRVVLMSLWRVDDEVTHALMEAFYRALWGRRRSPAEALREAQLWLRSQDGLARPDYWAGWSLVGDAFEPIHGTP
ncbi:MAG TPA: CHAT domain-containing tetratricopeptide repeat protein, partial [Rhodothermales bacterium]|nr:CHAT domain-containing tetratricopeptide repeat protein [Rhodothermales bacterium]